MHAKLLKPYHGRQEGGVFEVESINIDEAILKDETGEFRVPAADVEEVQPPEDTPQPRAVEQPPERQDHGDEVEALARYQYNAYNEAVGGVAWNGDPLPVADEFFEDPAKQKQANAWRVSVVALLDHARDLGLIPNYLPKLEDPTQGKLSLDDETGEDAPEPQLDADEESE